MTQQIIGLQLYTVRDETAKDFQGTLKRVAEMGYPGVEFAGYGNISSKDMASLLANYGLHAISSHVRLPLLEEDLERELNYSLDIGCNFLVIPSLDTQWRTSEGLRRLAPRMNAIGQRCKERGVRFGYHNHAFEFEQLEGKYLLDILLAETDPNLVVLELDTYWAAYGGADPIAYLRRYSNRVPLVHLKDMTPERTDIEIGAGILDIAGYCRVARESGAYAYLVENDHPTIPSLESVRQSLEKLRAIVEETK